MDEQSLLEWSHKAATLRRRYEEEHVRLLEELERFSHKGLLRRARPEKLQESAAKLKELVDKREIPLYNNIVNFGSMAANNAAGQDSVAGNLSGMVMHAQKVRERLQEESQLLEQAMRGETDAIAKIAHCVRDEEQHLKGMRKSIHHGAKAAMSALKQFQDAAYTSSIKAQQKLAEHKSLLKALHAASIGLIAFSAITGTDIGDLPKYLRKTSELLLAT